MDQWTSVSRFVYKIDFDSAWNAPKEALQIIQMEEDKEPGKFNGSRMYAEDVNENYRPAKGYVAFKKGDGDIPKQWRANFDSGG